MGQVLGTGPGGSTASRLAEGDLEVGLDLGLPHVRLRSRKGATYKATVVKNKTPRPQFLHLKNGDNSPYLQACGRPADHVYKV